MDELVAVRAKINKAIENRSAKRKLDASKVGLFDFIKENKQE